MQMYLWYNCSLLTSLEKKNKGWFLDETGEEKMTLPLGSKQKT